MKKRMEDEKEEGRFKGKVKPRGRKRHAKMKHEGKRGKGREM